MRHVLKGKWSTLCLIFLVIAAFLGLRYYLLYFEPEKPIFDELTSQELIGRHSNKSLKNLIEKSIVVEGTLKNIKRNNKIYTLYLSDKNQKTFILCQLKDEEIEKIPKLEIEQKIKIKGILKGHLKDVILLNCIIV